MDATGFNTFCASLPHSTHVVQWGGADVWKVGGKVFAIGWPEQEYAVTFKVSRIGFEMLRDQPGLRPAPYLASRGLLWIQHHTLPGLADGELQEYIVQSHRLVAAGLTKKMRMRFGL